MQSHLDPDLILNMVTSSLDSDKAEDVLSIPLGGKSSVADYMVIASGTSSRQVAAMAEHLEFRVHLFRPEVREFYGLERMWAGDGPQEVVTVGS